MPVTAFNRPPYFDDFSTPDSNGLVVSDKGYYRILFSPSYAVQNRELNQLQTILQDQIDKFGLSVYENGTPVIDGGSNFVDNVPFIDLEITNVDVENNIDLQKYVETVDPSSGVSLLKAEILAIQKITDQYRIWLRYLNSSGGNAVFQTSDAIHLRDDLIILPDGTTQTISGDIGTVQSTGIGFSLHVESGIFFVKGYFVAIDGINKYMIKTDQNETISGDIILRIFENTITSENDTTLLDNANGTFNFAAPGADRYQITVDLGLLTEDSEILNLNNEGTDVFNAATTEIDFVRILSITQSSVFTEARTEYSQLDRVLAERTFEESGNYTVRPFLVNTREFLRENNNGGRYTSSDLAQNEPFGITTESDARKLLLTEIDPSVAYVEGYRVDLAEKRGVVVDKARTLESTEGVYVAAIRGNYIDVVWDAENNPVSSIDDLFANGVYGQKVRNIEFLGSVTSSDPAFSVRPNWLRYRIYVYNNFDNLYTDPSTGEITPSGVTLPEGFEYRYLPGTIGGGSPITDSLIKNPENNRSIFALPYAGTETLDSITYVKQKIITGTYQGGSVYRFSGSTNEKFTGLNAQDFVLFNETNFEYLNPLSEINSITPDTDGDYVDVEFDNSTGKIAMGTDTVKSILPVRFEDTDATNFKEKVIQSVTGESHTVEDDGTIILNNQDVLMTSIEVTGDYYGEDFIVIDDGQGLNFYDSPILKLDASLAGSNVTVDYSYFNHTGTGDYFSVDSYENSGINFDEIPQFERLRLSDYIDFRVKRNSSGNLAELPARVLPNSIAQIDFTHYLPRADLLVVDYKSEFYIIKGKPALSPITPKTPSGAMSLYELYIPPYTYDPRDIDLAYIDNNRYTMADIGDLEKRVQKLEYYSSLSLLEKEATERKILDLREESAGVERFKSGILVDSFIGHSVGDVRNPDYLCSIDKENGILRPYYKQESYRLQFTGDVNGSTPVTPKPGEIGQEQLSLDEGDREILVSNLKASQTMSVQPYEVTTWEGSIRLSPSSDEWIDTQTRPTTTINLEGISNALEFIANEADGVLGTEWNAWQNAWQSRSSNSSTSRRIDRSLPHGQWIQDTTVTNTTTRTGQTRTGIRTDLSFNTVEQSLGERVVDLSIVPWIRSRDVRFRGTGFKPNTQLYAFFDDEDVTSFVKPDTFEPFAVGTDVTTYNGQPAPGGDFNNPLVTNDLGEIEGVFRIPNNEEQRFRTGQRVFRLTDNPQNNELESDSFAEAKYNAEGLIQEKETQILSTRVPEFTQTRLEDSRVVVSRSSRTTLNAFDPVAQTFVIGQNHPEGAFLTDVDLYFATKPDDDSIDAEVYLVSVENGIPTTNVIPGSRVRKKNSDVAVSGRNPTSSDPITNYATNFEFEYPVYLQAGFEYALIIFSKSPEYRIWTSEIGQQDVVSNTPIVKNPSFGVLLKSQNKRTWTPDQRKDVMLRMNKAVFPTGTVKEFTLSSLIDGQSQNMESFLFSLFNLNMETLNLPPTSIDFEVDFFNSSGTRINASGQFGTLENKENYALRSQIDSAQRVDVKARLVTNNSDVTPVIDLERVSMIGVENRVNDPISLEEGATWDGSDWTEGVANGGNAISRYITQRVSLQNPAEDLRVILAVNRPTTNCDIRVYAKRQISSEVDQSFANDVKWYEMPVYSVDSNTNAFDIPTHDKENEYSEIEYILPNPDPNITEDIEEFSDFAVKIVFISNDAAQVCKIRDLRAIASV